ncbi:MJ0307 family thioredoxin [Methanococcus voltae]|uniref:Redox-active disulfide protein 1 n=1 Tax=Methanococcus voltae (strain ATCC BAA-1334 / A3) TaxID=456320 RepID=D7DUU8_METV3|nr:MJ0307 family thioredoxin [Methanococcus voltae]MCS3900710.1 small redox-active disulfide protein 1 [Methanococcus voltae]
MVKVEVFSSPSCPHCPAAKRVVEQVVKEMSDIEVIHINVMEHPEKAIELGIMAVPAIAIDGDVVFVGAPAEEDFKNKLLEKINAIE